MEGRGFDQDIVDEFLEAKVIAVVGASTNREKYGYRVLQDLREGGYTVYPVNPLYEDIHGEKCYPDIASLPQQPDVVEFVCPPRVTESVLRELPSLGIDKAWIEFCRQHGIKALHDVCIMVERRKKGAG